MKVIQCLRQDIKVLKVNGQVLRHNALSSAELLRIAGVFLGLFHFAQGKGRDNSPS